jgi:CubicO group peptidase (beta-lactamase class C family)
MDTIHRRQGTRGTGVALVLLVCAASSAALAQTQDSDSPIEQRVREFANAINSGNPEQMMRLVKSSFGENLQKIPAPTHIAVLMSYWDTSRGLELHELQNAETRNETIAVFKNKLTGARNGIWFKVEPDPPHRIVAVGPRPAKLPQAPARQLSDSQIAHELEELVGRLSEADVFSGVVALAKDGTVVFQRAYGHADKNFDVLAQLDTKYNVASMGKMFTAVAIAQLVERDLLSFDDPLSKFLPRFPNEEASKKILVKHLLSHTAGLGMWWGPRWEQRSMKDTFATVDSMVAWAAQDETTTQFEPGTSYRYSNTGFVVLGKIIEQATGQSYYQYVQDHIFTPAGMTSTGYYESDSTTRKLATGYAKVFDAQGQATFLSNSRSRAGLRGGPAGGAYSTAGDMLKFGQALRAGKLLKPDNVAVLLSAKMDLGARNYGYGFDVSETRGSAGHGGGSTGISDNFEMFVRSGWCAVVMSNYTFSGFEASTPVVEKIRDLSEQSSRH